MTDRQLTVYRAGRAEQRIIEGPADYAVTLGRVFGLAIAEEDIARLRLFGSI
jgi:hypothetical protein